MNGVAVDAGVAARTQVRTSVLDVRLLYTVYPHFGSHAGMVQLARVFDPSRVRPHPVPVSDSDDDFPVRHPGIRDRVRARIGGRGVAWYKLSDIYAEWRALGAALTGGADIVHYLDGEHSASFLPSLLRRVRVVPTRTVATFHQPVSLLDELLDLSILADLDAVTVVAPEQQAWFESRVPSVRVETILHGIDTTFFIPGIRDPERAVFRCVTAGHWLRDWTAIRAVAERLQSERDIEFHIITSRPTGLDGLSNVVTHSGISDAELRDVYRGADVLFLPLTDSTANNCLLEGIACGLPVVSTALANVRAYLPGDQGIFIDGNDPDLLTDALLSLKRDPGARLAMGRRARARAEELAWPTMARRFEALYREVCA